MKSNFLAIEFNYNNDRTYKRFYSIKSFCTTYGIKIEDEYHQVSSTHNEDKNWQDVNYVTSVAVIDLSTLKELFHIDMENDEFDELYNYLADSDDIEEYITKK